MTCEHLSDRMPAVAAGTSIWSAAEREHLEGCLDCAAEWRILRRTTRLGQDAVVDAGRIAAAVVDRLAAAPARTTAKRRTLITAGVGLASAALLLLILLPGKAGNRTTPLRQGFEIPMPELNNLDDAQLQTVLQAIEEPLDTAFSVPAPSLLDLDDQQLERLLSSLEG